MTQRSKKQPELLIQDSRLTDVFDDVPAMIAVLTEPGDIFEYANTVYLENTGRSASIIGLPVSEAFPELSSQGILTILDEVVSTKTTYHAAEMPVHIANERGQTERKYFSLTYQPVINPARAVSHIFVHAVDITKQVVARKLAERSEDRYRTLFNSIDQGFCIIEMIFDDSGKPYDYRFVEVNHVFEQQTGLHHVTGKTVSELVPGLEGHWFETYGMVATTGKPARFTEASPEMGRWFDVFATRVGGVKSRQVVILFTDITERRAQEALLQESETYYREMADNMPVMSWVTDEKGYCTYLNRQWYTFTGQNKSEALGMGWTKAIHPDEQVMAGDEFVRSNNSHSNYQVEFRLRAANGSYRWVVDSGLPKFSSDGVFEGYIGTVIDIHERKLAEDALKNQLQLTEAITNNTTVCLFMIDANGLITFMNPAAELVTGFKPSEAIGTSMHNLLHHSHPDGRPFSEAECNRLSSYRQGGGSTTTEDVLFRKDGSSFPALINGMPVGSDHQLTATVIEFRDITAEKKSLDKIKRSMIRENKLEKTADLLRARSEELMALNVAKDEFINLASHQLRTPATGVKQYIGMLLEGYAGPLTDNQNSFLTTAYSSNERQLRIVDNLLKVARVDSGRVELRKEAINLVPFVEDIISEQASNFMESRQSIAYVQDDHEVTAVVDENLFRMVLENLIDNAHKYTEHGKAVTVQVHQLPKGARISVSDEGIGINPQEMDKLFQKFSRLDNPLSIEVGGTGLGLYWSKRVIDLHGGDVEVFSKQGEGTTFVVTIP